MYLLTLPGASPGAVAAGLYNQDSAAGAAQADDPEGEHEADTAAGGQLFLAPGSTERIVPAAAARDRDLSGYVRRPVLRAALNYG